MKAWLAKLEPKWVIQNAVILAVLCAVMYFMAFHMILPTQDHNFKMQDRVVGVQTKIAETQSRQTPILERIDKNTSK